MGLKLVVWTPEIDETLTMLRLEKGLSFPEVCDRLTEKYNLPFTRNGCIGRAWRLQLHKKVVKVMPVIRIDAPIIPLEALQRGRELSILQLQEGDCRWPSGEDRPPYTYCGQTTEIGRSFCPEHYEIAYHPARRQP